MDPQREIINKAIDIFEKRTGLKFKQRSEDRHLVLALKANAPTHQYIVVYKNNIIGNHILGITLNAMRELGDKGLIVAEYINPIIAKRLREMNVPFIDATGNAFLNKPPIYVFITGMKPEQKNILLQPKPFHAAALRVLFPLLCKPELLNFTLRELARNTGVALGTVANVMKELRIRKHMILASKGTTQFVNLKAIFQLWVMLYPTVLRPKLLLGIYTAPKDDWWARAKLPPDVIWGGDIAAAKLTGYLKPATATLYTHGKIAQVLVNNRLKEDPRGNIEILKAFWDQGLQLGQKGVAPALLVYTDLLTTGEPRSIEAAEMIYERELARHIEKN